MDTVRLYQIVASIMPRTPPGLALGNDGDSGVRNTAVVARIRECIVIGQYLHRLCDSRVIGHRLFLASYLRAHILNIRLVNHGSKSTSHLFIGNKIKISAK